MDPNVTLARIRKLMDEVPAAATQEAYMDGAAELMQTVKELDEWLSDGGFQPKAWSCESRGGI